MAPPAAGSACRSRRGKRTEHVLPAEDALSLPRNARLARDHGQGNKMELPFPLAYSRRIYFAHKSDGLGLRHHGGISLHVVAPLVLLVAKKDSEKFPSVVGAAAVAFKPVCPNRQSEAPADAVTLSYVTVLIHSIELLELRNDQIPILLQR